MRATHRPLRAPPAGAARRRAGRSAASRPGCGATPSRGLRRLAARPQRAAAGRAARRLLRPRPLQSGRLDRARCSTISTGSIRRRRGRARALRLPHALAARSRGLRPGRAERAAMPPARPTSWPHAARSAGQAAGLRRRRTARNSSTPRRTPAWSPPPSATTGSCTTAAPRAGTCATRHMFETLCSTCSSRAARAKAVVWAHNSHIGNAAPPRWAACARSSTSASSAASSFGDEAALIGFGTHTGTVAAAADWDGADGGQEVRPSRPDSSSGCATTAGVSRASCSTSTRRATCAARPAQPAAGALHRRHLPAGDRAAEPLRRGRAAAASSTPMSGSTRPGGDAAAHRQRPGVPETYPFGL